MIDQDHNDETLKALLMLSAHPETFHVCGSRWTGEARKASDFDFITEDVPLFNSIAWAFSNGKTEYLDQNTLKVRFAGHVHLILVRDVALRREAYRIIRSEGLNPKQTKVWKAVYERLGMPRDDRDDRKGLLA